MSYDIFISYRRNGGEHTAKIIKDSLTERGYDVFFDVESLRSGNFNTKLYSVIDECKDFIVILSPGSLERCSEPSDWVRREIEYAISKGKNIIPILLRGFKFDTPLPESISIISQMNGIEANTEFYDAFIKKVTTFLKSKPSITKRISAKGFATVGTVCLVAVILIVGGLFLRNTVPSNKEEATYPHTAEEINLTEDLLYCVGMNMVNLNTILGTMNNVFETAERYVQTNDFSFFNHEMNTHIGIINSIDEEVGKPAEAFMEKLSSSPFSTADLTAMHGMVKSDKEDALFRIERVIELVSPDFSMTKAEKLAYLNDYRKIYNEYATLYAINTNHLLTPVTDEETLKSFQRNTLSVCTNIPLSSSNWQNDKESLEITAEKCYTAINNALDSIDATFDYWESGAMQEMKEMRESIYQSTLPTDGDSVNMLWFKMNYLIDISPYDTRYADAAVDCINRYKALATDAEAEQYVPVLYSVADKARNGEVLKGIMVLGYEPGKTHSQYRIGDIIVSVGTESCFTKEKYVELKQGLTGEFDVGVLRMNENGNFDNVTLKVTNDMPLISIATMVYHDDTVE